MWFVAPVALIVVGVLGWTIYHQAYAYFVHAAARQTPGQPVNVNDALKATATVLATIGAVLAGLYAYRKQLLAESDAHRADASQLAERYATAAEQLGHEQAAVRLAGVYALARLADDWEEQRQVCINVLCAYLRMPYAPDPTGSGHRIGDREVRQTILSVIRDHLREPSAATAWCTYDLDFTDATFDGGDLSRIHFRGNARFNGSVFSEGKVNFTGASFSSGNVDFTGAQFSGGTLDFGHAIFCENIHLNFTTASLSAGDLSFTGTTFSDAFVSFVGAQFTGCNVGFFAATFSGPTVDFAKAEFTDGLIYFIEAKFRQGIADFSQAKFSDGNVDFTAAEFIGGNIRFTNAILRGRSPIFCNARFGDTMFQWGPIPVPPGAS
ncbi:pentapeptide repeat-containing protein [Streptomyces rimosus]|uniref:pentapeptide repeat-containing protein n=1 Tax=Streptomyces rimosus TaxID=1927 RepID=UPI001F222039|nr:pentapeptide repeat-containing protein [Streptomyces rimosus]